jgi:hypothetical protein
MPLRVVLIPQNPTILKMPAEDANTSDDDTLASPSRDTQLAIKPPFSLLSLQLANQDPKWTNMSQDEYEKILKDPKQEKSVNLAFFMVEWKLRESKWRHVRDPDFRTKQQTMVENADGDPITQINLRLAGLPACTRWSQAMKSKGGGGWDSMVERFDQVAEDLHIKVEPSQDQASAIEASLQNTTDGDSVLGSDAPKATDSYPDLDQNTDGSNTIQAPSCRATNSANADSAVSATCKFNAKQQ